MLFVLLYWGRYGFSCILAPFISAKVADERFVCKGFLNAMPYISTPALGTNRFNVFHAK